MRGGSYVRRNSPAGWPVLYLTYLALTKPVAPHKLSPDPVAVDSWCVVAPTDVLSCLNLNPNAVLRLPERVIGLIQ